MAVFWLGSERKIKRGMTMKKKIDVETEIGLFTIEFEFFDSGRTSAYLEFKGGDPDDDFCALSLMIYDNEETNPDEIAEWVNEEIKKSIRNFKECSSSDSAKVLNAVVRKLKKSGYACSIR